MKKISSLHKENEKLRLRTDFFLTWIDQVFIVSHQLFTVAACMCSEMIKNSETGAWDCTMQCNDVS